MRQVLTSKLQEVHEVISSLFIGLLVECMQQLAVLSKSEDLGEVGRELASDLHDFIQEVTTRGPLYELHRAHSRLSLTRP